LIVLEDKDSESKNFDMEKELRAIAKDHPKSTYFFNLMINVKPKEQGASAARRTAFGAISKGVISSINVTTNIVTLGQVDLDLDKKEAVKAKQVDDEINFLNC